MPHPTKIATCCYCGTRAALVLAGGGRHELACGSCGAPLHDLKMIRADRAEAAAPAGRSRLPSARAAGIPPRRLAKPKKVKRRKGFMSRLVEEAFDIIEDVLD